MYIYIYVDCSPSDDYSIATNIYVSNSSAGDHRIVWKRRDHRKMVVQFGIWNECYSESAQSNPHLRQSTSIMSISYDSRVRKHEGVKAVSLTITS